jgi:hypothetical protein
MCVKKRRYTDKDTPGARFGFRVFQKFYEITTTSKTPKNEMDFINSQFYSAFVKFGRHLIGLNPIMPEQFVDFVLKQGIPLDKWCNDIVYEAYLSELVKREPVEKAVERTIVEMQLWATAHQREFTDFFVACHPVEATHLIKSGKISPWVLYLSSTGPQLLGRMNEEQGTIIESAINPEFWGNKILQNQDDAKFVKEILAAAGV